MQYQPDYLCIVHIMVQVLTMSSDEDSPAKSLQKLALDISDSSEDENQPPVLKQKQREAGSLAKARLPPAVGTSKSAIAASDMSNSRSHSGDTSSANQVPSWKQLMGEIAPPGAYAKLKFHKNKG